MASHCEPHFLTPRLSFWLPALVLTMTWHFSVTESAAPTIQLRGEVGGKVTFHCPVAKQRTFLFLYFQRGLSFVNGYHASRNISKTWENTRMDEDKTTMHMYNLTMSHSGDYQCHILYSDSGSQVADIPIHLTVTAVYSTPALTVDCREENPHLSCRVTCTAHGGYPGSEVMWNVSGSQMWKVVNSSKKSDPNTKVVNSSSTAYINCSNGGLMSLSCSVGDVISDTVAICGKNPPDNPSPSSYVTAAICAVAVVSIITVALLLWWKCKKGQRRAAAVAVKVNGCEEEDTMLSGIKEEKEAS